MKKTITREVTFTKITAVKNEMIDGEIKASLLEPIIKTGNLKKETAQNIIHRDLGKNVTVLEVTPDSGRYEMDLEDFIHFAKRVDVTEEVATPEEVQA
ncbi:dsDNA binding protein [Bacillus phage VMY22]|uniref:Uncharacterized protein n=1 Tax=Bacillus phage VMY22 TaxID=1734382 RepID=A0A0N9SK06_9CAUD|nr:dsDNA binding protein [Bacillus phage VMY22]ALH46476.1 hypothetical protein VMY22_11 [Bacillus phage VMY22]